MKTNFQFKTRRALFLDRDGIINYLVDGRPPWHISEVRLYQGIRKIIQQANRMNYISIIVSNQPDYARNKISKEHVLEINSFIERKVGVYSSYLCLHGNDGECDVLNN